VATSGRPLLTARTGAGDGVTDLLRWGMQFPEKRSLGAGARHGFKLIFEHRLPAALGGATAIAIGAAVWCGAGYMHYQRVAAGEQAAAIEAERVNADLQAALARLQDQLGAARQSLNNAQGRISALSEDAQQNSSSKADRIGQLNRALEQAQRDLHLAEAQRATLMARASKAETDLADGQARQAQLQEWQKKVQQLTAERDKAASERDQLRARIGDLQKNSGARQPSTPVAEAQPRSQPVAPPAAAPVTSQAPVQAAAAQPAPPDTRVAVVVQPAPGAAQPETPRAVPAVAAAPPSGAITHLEKVLASAGVDVRHMFAQLDANRGQGGPFVPLRPGQPEPLSPEKLAALRVLLKMLPVSAPLQSYEISSPFGARGDPENGHASFHTGVDLRAPYMSPVYATASGVVSYAGYRDDYGKVVEIDHGNGISTRYAHLSRYVVSVGQQIPGHSQIGFLGSTGRATGPHVHYEVLVNGEPQDPEKFLGLARVVQAAQR
jgi:murein DD-endopeptidase MepM/ murein hydrolase activator NlpD